MGNYADTLGNMCNDVFLMTIDVHKRLDTLQIYECIIAKTILSSENCLNIQVSLVHDLPSFGDTCLGQPPLYNRLEYFISALFKAYWGMDITLPNPLVSIQRRYQTNSNGNSVMVVEVYLGQRSFGELYLPTITEQGTLLGFKHNIKQQPQSVGLTIEVDY